jgi:hypothetical protein
MRENRLSGSEGGAGNTVPTPIGKAEGYAITSLADVLLKQFNSTHRFVSLPPYTREQKYLRFLACLFAGWLCQRRLTYC